MRKLEEGSDYSSDYEELEESEYETANEMDENEAEALIADEV